MFEIFTRLDKIHFVGMLGGTILPIIKMCDTHLKKDGSVLLYLNILGFDTLILCLVGVLLYSTERQKP